MKGINEYEESDDDDEHAHYVSLTSEGIRAGELDLVSVTSEGIRVGELDLGLDFEDVYAFVEEFEDEVEEGDN